MAEQPQVKTRYHLSDTFSLYADVPQGSEISPQMYIVFTKDTPGLLPHPTAGRFINIYNNYF